MIFKKLVLFVSMLVSALSFTGCDCDNRQPVCYGPAQYQATGSPRNGKWYSSNNRLRRRCSSSSQCASSRVVIILLDITLGHCHLVTIQGLTLAMPELVMDISNPTP